MSDSALYDRDYFTTRSYGLDEKRRVMYLQEHERICERTAPGRILDIGCGTGDFLSCFDNRWTRYGFEPSEFARSKAEQKGICMVNGMTLTEMDVVVFRGVLQHIETPMESLIHATGILKKGGLLAILATPDTDSLVYKLFGNLPALDAPHNWVLFGSRYLANILIRRGYGNIEILHPYLSTPYASPLKDACKFCASLLLGYRKFAFPGNMFEMYGVKL
jgi:SAM-dependent methyltransferase